MNGLVQYFVINFYQKRIETKKKHYKLQKIFVTTSQDFFFNVADVSSKTVCSSKYMKTVST